MTIRAKKNGGYWSRHELMIDLRRSVFYRFFITIPFAIILWKYEKDFHHAWYFKAYYVFGFRVMIHEVT